MLKELGLGEEDLEVVAQTLEDGIELAEDVLELTINDDQTPETLDEFMALCAIQTERIARLKLILERVRELQ